MTEPDCLKLLALDDEDLAVLSAHVQDAVLKVADLVNLPKERRFALGMNRFIWEKAEGGRKNFERRRAALTFDRVLSVLGDVWTYCERTGTAGRTVTVKVKYADFQIITRSRTLDRPVNSRAELEKTSVELVRQIFPLEKRVRLLGVSLSNMAVRGEEPTPEPQLTLGL